MQHPALRRDRQGGDLRFRQIGRSAMRDHDPFGPAGGSRCVDHISEVFRIGRVVRGLSRMPRDLCPVVVEPDDECIVRRQLINQACLRQHHAGSGIRQHVGEPVGRIAGVERQICAACLENSEDAGEQRE